MKVKSTGELLNTENDVAEILKMIILRFKLARESGKKLKKIFTDTENTYLRKVVDAFCTRNHILHDTQPGA
jgi:hypothetical protein